MAAQNPFQEIDPQKLAKAMTNASGQCHEIVQDFLNKQNSAQGNDVDPLGLAQVYLEFTALLMKKPEKLMQAQMQAWNTYNKLWMETANAMLGKDAEPTVTVEKDDRRFKHEAWDNNPFFDFIKQSYLLTANTIESVIAEADDLDEKSAHKLQFYSKQFVDAMSPSNFALSNPEVIEAIVESKGENLVKGMKNFCRDFDAQTGDLKIKMSDRSNFELGKSIATTPGKVVFQNDLLQLIQYLPKTEEVHKRPLLIMPPWINKYYILDLQEKNSLIKWLVEQGHSVFVISWVNPDEKLGDKDFEDYVIEGAVAAIDAIEKATGEKQVNVIGYCIGGTLLGATLAYLTAKKDKRIVSATFFVSLLDFSEPGDLGIFIDEKQLQSLEDEMNKRGYHDGAAMSKSFSMLRANDLIWSFYVHNYLLGKDPFPFDLIFWNTDSTRMPAKMHSTYLRTMYLENKFKEPGGMTIGNVDIDLSSIKTPAYFVSAQEDHIAPWGSTYLGAQLLSGPVRFVLGRSGHIAGIVNPPAAKKYGYFTGSKIDVDAKTWLDSAKLNQGSWWPEWNRWAKKYAGEKVPARSPGDGGLPVIEDAPGSYVKKRY